MLAIELEHYWSALSRGLSGRLDHLTPAWSLSIHSQTGVLYHPSSNIEMLLELWKLSEVTLALPAKDLNGQQTRCHSSSKALKSFHSTKGNGKCFRSSGFILKNGEWAVSFVDFKSWNATQCERNDCYSHITVTQSSMDTCIKPSCWMNSRKKYVSVPQTASLTPLLRPKIEAFRIIPVYKPCQCITNQILSSCKIHAHALNIKWADGGASATHERTACCHHGRRLWRTTPRTVHTIWPRLITSLRKPSTRERERMNHR